MKVLMITGDIHFAASARYALQAAQVDTLTVVYWGRRSLWPTIPPGPYDVITAQDPFWRGLFAWRVARHNGARLNIQVHTDLSAQSLVLRVLAQIILRHADSVRVVSEKIKRQVEQLGAHASIHVLPIFIDLERFRRLSRISHEGKLLLWVGRFEPEKDPLAALLLLEQIRETGIDARLIMLGSGSLATRLHECARGLPVEFPGWKDPAPYLERADVVVSTSKHESYGASIVEALAAGVPVVASDVGIAREAGAIVAEQGQLVAKVVEVLRQNIPGKLRMTLPSADEWAAAWKCSLT